MEKRHCAPTDLAGPSGLTRGAFLSRVGGLALAGLGVNTDAWAGTPAPRWKGRPDSRVGRWDVVTIGNLSRNRYWGEGDAQGIRAAICTCTVITGEGFRLLVDPSLASAAEMTRELDRRTGMKPRDVTAVFVTHEHGDHVAGLAHFPEARWLASPAVAERLNQSGRWSRRVEGTTDRLFNTIEMIPTPGHTDSHHSLRFDCEGLSIVLAGDAVATRDFFRARQGYYNAVDFELSARSMDKLAAWADIIVPGHDNYFLVDPVPRTSGA